MCGLKSDGRAVHARAVDLDRLAIEIDTQIVSVDDRLRDQLGPEQVQRHVGGPCLVKPR